MALSLIVSREPIGCDSSIGWQASRVDRIGPLSATATLHLCGCPTRRVIGYAAFAVAGDNKPALVALRRRRDQVIDALSEHFANDALTIEDLEDRLDLAHQATALEHLEQLLEDLEVVATGDIGEESQALVVSEKRDLSEVGQSEAKPIRAILSSVRRKGAWRVPRKLRVLSVLGDARIDLRDVQLPPGVTEIHAKSILGSVEIIVPPTLAVECEGTAVLGEIEEMHRAPAQPDPETPLLIVSARAVLGELKIKTRLPAALSPVAKRQPNALERAREAKRLTDGS